MTFSNLGLHSFPEKSETVTPAEAAPVPAAPESSAPPVESCQNTEGNRELTLIKSGSLTEVKNRNRESLESVR